MYALYDQDSNRYEVGKKVLTRNAANQHEELVEKLAIKKNGYIETFVVNETSQDVWFDNFRVLSTGSLLVQETHYDPWGLELTGIGYEYGGIKVNNNLYNGKEIMRDHNLELYDYGQRMYDPTIGRFNRIDRFSEKYNGLSPFQYGANNPIKYIDVNGDSIIVNTQMVIPTITGGINVNASLHFNNGTFNFQNGAQYSGTDQFVSSVNAGLNELGKSNAGNEMISNLVSSTKKVTVLNSTSNQYSPSKKEVSWNTESNNLIPTEKGLQTPKPFMSLGHELAHAEDHVMGTLNTSRTWTSTEYPQAEKFATHRENQIRGELGMPLRTHYGMYRSSSGSLFPNEESRIIKNGFSNFYPMKVGPFYMPYLYKK